MTQVVVAAAVQATPVFLDRDATVEKVVELTEKAAAQGAGLVVFPEAFVPAYPDWVWRTPAWSDRPFYEALAREAVSVPSTATDRMGEAARAAQAWLAVGVNERDPNGGTLLQHLAVLRTRRHPRRPAPQADTDRRRAHHLGPRRRLHTFRARHRVRPARRPDLLGELHATGPSGALRPGLDVHLAPTWDTSDCWLATLRHIAKEGRVYVIGTNSYLRGSDVPAGLPGRDGIYGGDEDHLSHGGTAIIGPDGTVLAGPLHDQEGILYAEIDVAVARASRREFDPVGHYARPDVFTLTIDTTARPPAIFANENSAGLDAAPP